MKDRKIYTKEFKEEAVRLLNKGDRQVTELARNLGVRRNQLYKWREQISQKGSTAFPGHGGRPKADECSEIQRLRRELKQVTEERDILKKAETYFANQPK